MGKLNLMLCVLFFSVLLSSCSNDDEPSSYNVMVNVSVDGDIASPTLVRLYDYDKAKDFDKDAIIDMGDYQKLVDMSGNVIEPEYTSGSFSGVNIFENINQGKYLIVVMHKPSGFTFPMFYYYGYKSIVVDKDNNTDLYNFDFGSGDRGVFVEF